VLELTEGYPFFLQEYGRRVWSQDDEPTITLEDVEAARPVVEADLDEEFYETGSASSPPASASTSQDLPTSAMVRSGSAPADLLGRATTSLSPVRDDLMRSAVIYSPRRGYLDFTVPHCARFVRRHCPFDA
jgi:hypothetical protein